MPRTVVCPHCAESVVWGPQSPFRPFCSERCRQMDLGAWASGDYAIPVEPALDDHGLDAHPILNDHDTH